MFHLIALTFLVAFALNFAMFLVAFKFRSDKLTDISYAVTFLALAIMCFEHGTITTQKTISLIFVSIWAVRIGSFLLVRVMRNGKDGRFDEMRSDFVQFGRFWVGQALTVWVLMLPVALSATHSGTIDILSYLGGTIFIIGLIIETVADLQKSRFKRQPTGQHPWIDTGLWHYSRHPNYFGEILVWIGIYGYEFSNLSPVGRLIGLTSPLFITMLLRFVSGVPILEKSADDRWGSDPAYAAYKKRTTLVIPVP